MCSYITLYRYYYLFLNNNDNNGASHNNKNEFNETTREIEDRSSTAAEIEKKKFNHQ